MAVASLFLLVSMAAAQAGFGVFDDPFTTYQWAYGAGNTENFTLGYGSTSAGISFERTITILPGFYTLVNNDFDAIAAFSDDINNEFVISFDTNQNGKVIIEWLTETPIDQMEWNHFAVDAIGQNDLPYNLIFTACSGGCDGSCSVSSVNMVEAMQTEWSYFFPQNFIGNADFSAVDCFSLEVNAQNRIDISIKLIETRYWECDESELEMLLADTDPNLLYSDECDFPEEGSQNPDEACQVCCDGTSSCFTYVCTEASEIEAVPGEWVVSEEPVCTSIMVGDPHLTGFNGEKLDIAHDVDLFSKNYLSVFCTETVSYFAELASTPEGDVYIVSFFGRYVDEEFSFNIFDGLSLKSTVKSDVIDGHKQQFELADGQLTLASDARSISTNNGVIKATVSIKSENGFDYLDLVLTSLIGRYPAGGVLGRTLEKHLGDDFNEFEPFLLNQESLSTFMCEVYH